ncbi:MAG: efflux RND transporter periplasmic adaptor subunit [Acidimicrobiales bacterium]|nr:efflux RND transporter periplasmic adaptor subunit [Hyphomonadaceae bacterium]RZV44069.1 MAG: efflux RND transporter periplasmic adaptor subunit [Acidimicrobiales bacterium]
MANENTSSGNTGPAKRPGKVKRFLLFMLPLIVLLLAVFAFMQMGKLKPQPETKTEPPRAAPVVTASAIQQDVELFVTSQGEVRPRSEINFAAQVGGKINYISPNYLEGGQFKKGEILLRIESTEYDLRVTQAMANVAQAETALTRELSEADIAKQDWEDLGAGQASALTLRQPQVAEARARVAASTAALNEAKLSQSRTIIRAPFDGRVREKLVDRGEYVTPGQKLGRIYGVETVEVKLPLTDGDLGRIGLGIGFQHSTATPGPEVIFTADVAGQAQEWRGRLVRTNSSYDASTRVLFAYAEVKDPYGKNASNGTPLASGLFVSARIAGKVVNSGIVIPRNALRGADRVYIANADNTLSIRQVAVAASARDQVVIISGISEGDQVITSPVRSVAEGMKIEIAKPGGNKEKVLTAEDAVR